MGYQMHVLTQSHRNLHLSRNKHVTKRYGERVIYGTIHAK